MGQAWPEFGVDYSMYHLILLPQNIKKGDIITLNMSERISIRVIWQQKQRFSVVCRHKSRLRGWHVAD